MLNKGLVYHYTSVDAFFKILSSGEIWLSDARKMNDYSEIETCFKLLNNLTQTYPQLATILPAHFASQFMHRMDYYLCSFSQHSDALSQWFRYGQNGAGIALGFSYSNDALIENYHTPYLHGLTDLKIQARPVEYIQDSVRAEPESLFKFLFEFLRDSQNLDSVPQAIDTLFEKSMTMKHGGFFEEGEVRIGCFAPRPLGTNSLTLGYGKSPFTETLCNLPLRQRSTGKDIVRYLPLPINKNGLYLKKIIKGPTSQVDDADIRFLLEKALGVDNMEIVSSTTPYRP